MAPRPQAQVRASDTSDTRTGNEVVISGLSGKFPESPNVQTFMQNLYNKTDMVTGDGRRWELEHPEIPQRTGKIDNFNKFDAQFFGVHYKQACTMEPMSRMLLENAYGAIFDAGINPRTLKNTKTGVFIGSSFSESEKVLFFEKVQANGLGISGCSRAMYANRISYWLGTTGPSYTLDASCSSSLLALEHAYRALRRGQCDAAIVGGVNLCLQPYVSLHFRRLGYLALDGITKTFDKNADGYARAESISVVFLQRAKDAKRVYAEVVHVMTNVDGYKTMGPSNRSAECVQNFLDDFYREVNVLPKQVEFIEAFGSGLADADREELEAYDQVFCKERSEPVLVGSVKSNMGHSEPASGVNAVTKVCLAYHKGSIAPNLHCSKPRDDVAGVREGRIQVVTEPAPFKGGYSAVCSYGLTGVNVHALLKGYAKEKHLGHLLRDDLPRLVVASGRSDFAVKKIFTDVCSRPVDPEHISLLHSVFETEINGHVYRGYDLIAAKDGETVSLSQHTDYHPGTRRPVWFVYSGMGSQWSGMGTDLMRIPVFAAAIERCCRALAPKGLDLMRILTDPNPAVYDNILHSFVGIAAVQIGLTDILSALGITPDRIIGHSVGELGCAYADGCFTAEEMILAAYSRGLVSVQTPFIRGSMAAVGRGYQEMKNIVPPEIEIACHNGPESCTISGPSDAMKEFVAKLTADGVFAKEVPCSNIAYHSKYIANAGPGLLKYLTELIKDPKPRSAKWVSSSVPQSNWNQESAKYSSAEYHTNNLLSPVLFEESSRVIPADAITIEIAPHGLLQAILRRSLHADCVNVPITKRGHKDNVQYLLDAIGKLYVAGLNPRVANLYPAVEYPVCVDTPLLSHLVEWEHTEDWFSPQFHMPLFVQSGQRKLTMHICDQENRFLTGNVISGTMLFPAAGYLVLAWETLAMMLKRHYPALSVEFEDVKFLGDLALRDDKTVILNIMVNKGNGKFEICAEGNELATGTIRGMKSSLVVQPDLPEPEIEAEDDILMSDEDVYTVLAIKGYTYSGVLRGIQKSDVTATRSELTWSNNWVSFLESMMQLEVLGSDWNGIVKPREIRRISINVRNHRKILEKLPEEQRPVLPCFYYVNSHLRRSGGVDIIDLQTYNYPKVDTMSVKIKEYQFVPTHKNLNIEKIEAVRLTVQHALQNTTKDTYKVLEIVNNESESHQKFLETILNDSLHSIKEYAVRIVKSDAVKKYIERNIDEINSTDLVVIETGSVDKSVLQRLVDILPNDTFVLSRESTVVDEKILKNYDVVSQYHLEEDNLVLLKKRSTESNKCTKYITVKASNKYPWLQLVQAEWRKCSRLVLVSECDPCSGLLGMFNCLRHEQGGQALSLLLIDDYSAPAFRPDLSLYRQQLDKNLALNVYKNGEWGSFQYIPMTPVEVQAEHVYLSNRNPEDVNSITWLRGLNSMNENPSKAGVKRVQVYFSAISEYDIQNISGFNHFQPFAIGKNNSYGIEFSGRMPSGDRVMGLVSSGALSSIVDADVNLLWPIPSHWSLEDAATVPVAYSLIYHTLEITKKLLTISMGLKILVHGGDQPLGEATIRVSLIEGYKVYTTVDTLHKKKMLMKMFPHLQENQVGNSSDVFFEDTVMSDTKGEGCDLILNTLSGPKLKASTRCLSHGGYFVNMSSDDMKDNYLLGMSVLAVNRNYTAINIRNIFREQNKDMRKKIQQNVAAGIARGAVTPLSRVVMEACDVKSAFRLASRDRHVGKALLQLRKEEMRPLVTPSRAPLTAHPKFLCRPDAIYVVVSRSALDRPALQLADWLVSRGATNLMLTCPRTPLSAYSLRRWHRLGVQVHLHTESLRSQTDCLQMLANASAFGLPVAGVFVAPNVGIRENFELARLEHLAKELKDTALVVMNLDSASRKVCPHLEQFVVVSGSAAVGRPGASGQAGADSVVQRLCEERSKLALPALALQLEDTIDQNGIVSTFMDEKSLSAIDYLLVTKTPVALASKAPAPLKYHSVIEAVEDITGLALSNYHEEQTLEQLKLTQIMLEELRLTLEREFDTYCARNKLLSSTINNLRNMEPKDSGKEEAGLGWFFSYIDPEEFSAASDLVGMATLVSNGLETESEFNKKDKYLILVPSMEGHRHVFPTVAERLKVKAYSCQLGLDDINETIPDTAVRLCKVVLRRMEPGAQFSLLGYGFGVAVALEMAVILESSGHTGNVFCLDGSPRWFSALLDARLGHLNERQLQDEMITHMFRVISGASASEELRGALAAESDWERKLDVCMRHLRGRVHYSFQYQRSLVAMAYARIRQARAYDDAGLRAAPLRSVVTLLAAKRRVPELAAAAQRLGRDLGLGAYVSAPVRVHELDCDHAAAPRHLQVSDIVNTYVADMEHFKTLNLCMPYMVEDENVL